MNETIDDDDRRVADLVSAGAEIAGAATGGALGLLGGPLGVGAGAVGGVVVSRALRRVGSEIAGRIGGRQAVRVGAAYVVAADRISARLLAGDALRDDDFFDEAGAGHGSPAEEILEGVLLRAANEYEERKVRYLGALYASVAFSANVSASEASYLLRLAEQLTYSQLVLLGIFVDPHADEVEDWLRENEDFAPHTGGPLITEFDDLSTKGLVGVKQGPRTQFEAREVLALAAVWNGSSFTKIALGDIGLTKLGATLAELMALSEIPTTDKVNAFEELLR